MARRDEAAHVGMSVDRLARIEPCLQRFVDDGTIAGCNVYIARRGQTVYQASIGLRDREASVPMTDDTIFRIYSMTKPIVSTALMLLWEQGHFNLKDPVAAYLPAFGATKVLEEDGSLRRQTTPMTIRHLLSHTSGLSYDFLEETPVGQMYRDARLMNDATRSLEALVDALAEIPLASQPGSTWRYSIGIDVVARLIEVISGQTLQDFLGERLFEPLAMSDTAFTVDEPDQPRLAAMYGIPDLIGPNFTATDLISAALAGVNERQDVSDTYPVDGGVAFARGGLGLFSTVGDYAEFANLLRNGRTRSGERLLSRKTLDLMHTNHLPPQLLPWQLMGEASPGFGFGLGSRVMLDPALVGLAGSPGAFGWAGAAKTYYWVDPVEDMVGVFMAQYMTGPVNVDHTFRTLAYQAIDD